MKRLFFTLATFLLILSSCSETVVFKEYRKMKNITWNRFNTLEFDVPVAEGNLLDFDLALRHHTDFPYDKLFVNITFYSPDGEMRSGDYEFNLKDEAGNWLAKGMGELWDIELPVRTQMHFYEAGICKVRIESNYPKIDTPGIIEVGLLVKKSAD